MQILEEDFEKVLEDLPETEKFNHSTFFITGATGLIGSLCLKFLLYCKKKKGMDIRIIAVVRDSEKAERIYRNIEFSETVQFIVADLEKDELEFHEPVDYVIHAAAITASRIMVENPVGTIMTSVTGTARMLELAVKTSVRGMVYISSMEVYGNMDKDTPAAEIDLGKIDLFQVRSGYPESKRLCECLCNAYASQYHLNVSIARLAQTFGAGVLENENRVFAQFARSAVKKEDIVLHTMGRSEGNYVYTADAVAAIFLLLMKGEPGQAYNVANEASHMTIAEMAHLVADEIAGGEIMVRYDIPEDSLRYGYAPDVKLKLDAGKLKDLGWTPKIGLKEAYERMIVYGI